MIGYSLITFGIVRFLPFLILLFFSELTSAQNFKDNLYQSFGFTYFLDVSVSQIQSFTYKDYIANEVGDLKEADITGYTQATGISVITGIYRIRYNVLNFEESALTLSLAPALSLSHVDVDAFSEYNNSIIDPDKVGNGQFNFPILLGYESGLGSQKDLDSKFGWLVKLGYEYTLSPLIYQTSSKSPYLTGLWGQPALVCAVRFKNKRESLREINLKLGHIPVNDVPDENADGKIKSPMTFRISFFRQIK